MSQIIIGFTAEGTTDVRLFEGILQRTFEDIALECSRQIEVISPIINISKEHGLEFNEQIFNCANEAFNRGVMVFCVHADSDGQNDANVLATKITPSFEFVSGHANNSLCKNLVAIVPIQMSESWMLADKELLKSEIGTEKSDLELGINRAPESYANPKAVIEAAIVNARKDLPKRRRHELRISELYQPIGLKVDLRKLELLTSYQRFKESVRNAYRNLNYLQ